MASEPRYTQHLAHSRRADVKAARSGRESTLADRYRESGSREEPFWQADPSRQQRPYGRSSSTRPQSDLWEPQREQKQRPRQGRYSNSGRQEQFWPGAAEQQHQQHQRQTSRGRSNQPQEQFWDMDEQQQQQQQPVRGRGNAARHQEQFRGIRDEHRQQQRPLHGRSNTARHQERFWDADQDQQQRPLHGRNSHGAARRQEQFRDTDQERQQSYPYGRGTTARHQEQHWASANGHQRQSLNGRSNPARPQEQFWESDRQLQPRSSRSRSSTARPREDLYPQHQEQSWDPDQERQQRPSHDRGDIARPEDTADQAGHQASEVINVKHEWTCAVRAVKHNNFAQVMELYTELIDGHFAATSSSPDYTLLSGALYGTARIWLAALDSGSLKQDALKAARQQLQPFLKRMLEKLQSVLSEMGSREISSTFWAFANIGLSPDAVLEGSVSSLAEQYIGSVDTAIGRSHASVILACEQFQLDPCEGRLLQAVLSQLESTECLDCSAQDLANITYSLSKIPKAKPSTKLLDLLCERFSAGVQSPTEDERPAAQHIASFAWGLQQLRHAPHPKLAVLMTKRFVHLCGQKGQQYSADSTISTFLFACAQLQFELLPKRAALLVRHLLRQNRQTTQDLANAAWSLAALKVLQLDDLKQMVPRLSGKQLQKADLVQIYQAMDSLTPAPHNFTSAWTELQVAVRKLGPRPKTMPRKQKGIEQLSTVLDALDLKHQISIPVKNYFVDALILPPSSAFKSLLIVVDRDDDFLANDDTRLVGRVVFQQQLLAQEGVVVRVPEVLLLPGNEDFLTEHLKPALQTAVEGNLAAYQM